MRRIAEQCRAQGKRIIFTNGCFDILHAGHVTYLEKAKQMGDILMVGLNADASVKRIKGPQRPINPVRDRAKVLAALEAVNYVTVFSEDTPLHLIQELKPHILVKGTDWKKEKIVGRKEIKSWGGRVRRVSFVPGKSTTRVLKKIQTG